MTSDLCRRRAVSVARRMRRWVLLPVLLVGAAVMAPSETAFAQASPEPGIWTTTGSLGTGRVDAEAALLPSGKVLIVGGRVNSGSALATAETYDAATGTWTAAAPMSTGRTGHTATRLPSGNVLVVGGFDRFFFSQQGGRPLASAELYDPETGQWRAAESMGVARSGHAATLLDDGRILVTGGTSSDGTALASSEVYDPATGKWTTTAAPMGSARTRHTATVLQNGKVLVAGGSASYEGTAVGSAEIYDPASGRWTGTAPLDQERTAHTATLLPGGKVLVAGGAASISRSGSPLAPTASAEIYDPSSGRWTNTAGMAFSRAQHVATLLGSGKIRRSCCSRGLR